MKAYRKYLLAGVAILGWVGPASAQDNSTPGDKVETVIVTAQKRSENEQTVPISMSVITSVELTNRTSSDLYTALDNVPNLSYDSPDDLASSITIRGISTNTDNIGIESGVGVYLDDVYIPRPVDFNMNLIDIDQIEVLRGPQGTLFGKNTVAGAIVINTKPPSENVEGGIDFTSGNYSLYDVKGYLSGPLAEDLYGKISFGGRWSSGWAKNLTPGMPNWNGDNSRGVRGQLKWDATQKLSLLLSADWSLDKQSPNFQEPLIAPIGVEPFDCRCGATNAPNNFHRESWGTSLRANAGLGAYTLTSITAYRGMDSAFVSDGDHTELSILTVGRSENFRYASEEARIASPDFDWGHFLVGAFVSNQKTSGRDHYGLGPDLLQLYTGISLPSYKETADVSSRINDNDYAFFASGEYRIADRLRLTGGIRYTWEDKSLNYMQTVTPFGGIGLIYALAQPVTPRKVNLSDSAPSGDVSLDFDVTDQAMLYAKYSRGFKAGGFDSLLSSSPNPSRLSFGAETLDNYEIGAKSNWLDDHLQVNGAAFYMVYNNKQEQYFDGTQYIILNAAGAVSKGFELQITAVPFSGLQITEGLGYADAYYTSFRDPIGGTDFTGNRLPGPPITNSTAIQYETPIGNGLSLFARAEAQSRTAGFIDSQNTAFFKQKGSTVYDARLAIGFDDDKYQFALWGRNLTNVTYIVGGQSLLGAFDSVALNPPRTFGIELSGSL